MVDVPELEDQDQAEVLDETNLTRDGDDIANFDEIPDVLDVTTAIGDEDEDDENREAGEDEDGETRDLFDEFSDGDDEAEVDDSPRTRLEDRPEDTNLDPSDDEADGVDRADLNARDPIDEAAGDEADAPARGAPSRFESETLSDRQLVDLGYKN